MLAEKDRTALEFIYRRRSVRKFTEQPISNEVIEQLIDAAIHAPSGKKSAELALCRGAQQADDSRHGQIGRNKA